MWREISPRPFFKKSKLSISLDEQSGYSLFSLHVQVEVYQNILKLSCWPLALILYKAFSKNKKRSGSILSVSFSAWFLRKISLPDCLCFLEMLHTMCIVIICLPACDLINFEINLSWPKSEDQNLNIVRTKI